MGEAQPYHQLMKGAKKEKTNYGTEYLGGGKLRDKNNVFGDTTARSA